jgi:hypothetical protein
LDAIPINWFSLLSPYNFYPFDISPIKNRKQTKKNGNNKETKLTTSEYIAHLVMN